MIYLIDDKTQRQKEAGWDDESFKRLSSILKPIHLYSEIDDEEIKKQIFTNGNVVLFHESFFDNVLNKHDKKGIEIRNALIKFAKSKELFLVIFSGSKNIRFIDGNIAHMPVSVLYQNLELFCVKSAESDLNLRYLLFGFNHNLEEQLLLKLKLANISFRTEDIQHCGNNFIALTQSEEIDLPYEGIDNEMLFTDEISDEFDNDIDLYISQLISKWFQFKEYDNIFIPISFGQTLSDFNGLRFALHIRCSENLNRFKNIYIYSYVTHNEIINNSYFDVLKTKNIFLIDYKFSDFSNAIKAKLELFKFDELSYEINKIKLDAPKSYEDSHSISNEWAISRWAKALNSNDDEINNISNKIKFDVYFKYLNTIYPKNEIGIIPLEKLKLTYVEKPHILYIDDEANKGWYEILCKILKDENKLDFDHIDDELNSSSQADIIELTIDNIVKNNIDVVILDFRLHQDDFKKVDIEEITGFKILKRIKEYNPGIQVIIFSATNKAYNLLALQEYGADGFIIKESPDKSDAVLTMKTVDNFIDLLNKSLNKIFLKEFYVKLNKLKKELIPRMNKKKSDNPLPKEFVDESIKWLELSCDILIRDTSPKMIAASFVLMFSVLENISNRLINVDFPIPIVDKRDQQKYMFEFRGSDQKLKRFIDDENNIGFYRRTNGHLKSSRNIPWTFKILNALDFITKNKMKEEELSILIKKRNDLIHANATTGDIIDIKVDLLINLYSIIYEGLINIK
jgi:DNA-binding NarL/FixJ family response regulator